jgi:hypothetical protein
VTGVTNQFLPAVCSRFRPFKFLEASHLSPTMFPGLSPISCAHHHQQQQSLFCRMSPMSQSSSLVHHQPLSTSATSVFGLPFNHLAAIGVRGSSSITSSSSQNFVADCFSSSSRSPKPSSGQQLAMSTSSSSLERRRPPCFPVTSGYGFLPLHIHHQPTIASVQINFVFVLFV